jgi:Tol biopolymer transport system component
MRSSIKILFCTALLISNASSYPPADWITDLYGKNSGNSTCNFLTLPVSAGSMGMSSSNGMMDATDIPRFTANTALATRDKFAVTHLEWLMGMRKEYAGALFPFAEIGTVGMYSQLFTPGEIGHARNIDEQPSHPRIAEYSLGATFARSFFDKTISAGCALSYVESRLDTEVGRAVAGGIDLLFDPIEYISARIYGLNFGSPVSYNNSYNEYLPLQTGVVLSVKPLSQRLKIKSIFDFTISTGVQKTSDEPLLCGGNLEIRTGQYIQLRAGYDYRLGEKASAEGLCFGASLNLPRYGADFGYKIISKDLGSVWSAGIKFQLEEIIPKTAEEYFKIAQSNFTRNHLKLCVYYAKKALELDPNMWKAHALLSAVNSQVLRSKHLEIALIYSGNIKGQFLVPPEQGSFGGLARLSTAISALRNQFPVSFTVSTGNLLTSISSRKRAEIERLYLEHVKFDATAAGEQEISLGLDKLGDVMKRMPNGFICSNYSGTSSLKMIKESIIEKDEYRIFVASVVNPLTVNKELSGKLNPVVDEINSRMAERGARACDLRVLIVHDSWERIKSYASRLQGVDIIICGSIDQYFQSPMRAGSSYVLSAGSKGQYLGNCILRFSKDKKLVSVDNRIIPVSSEIAQDTSISGEIGKMAAGIDLEEQGIDSDQLTKGKIDGTILFVSDRDNDTGIYLKVIDNKAEFPLTRGTGNCSNPSVSFQAGKISYIRKNNGRNSLMIMDVCGAHKTAVAESLNVTEAEFSPDGKWVYFAASKGADTATDIYRVSSVGGPALPVVTWKGSAERWISFSQDMSLMAFCSDRDGTWQIYICNPLGEQPIRLTDFRANSIKPEFSPDGKKLVYLSDALNSAGRYDLWIYDRIYVTNNPVTQNANVKQYCWFPDSKKLVFTTGMNLTELDIVDITSFRFAKLLIKGNVKDYSEISPLLVQYQGKLKILYVREDQDGKRKVFMTSPDGADDTRIVNSKGSDWLP